MSDYQDEWLKRIEAQLEGIRAAVAPLASLSQRLEEHHSALYGNGQPGLIKDMERMKQTSEDQRRSIKMWLLILLGVSAVGGSAPELVRAAVQAFLK